MPYEWTDPREPDARACLHLWPHRSLPKRGFALFIGATFLLLTLPLFAVMGTAVMWGLLPFLMAALALLYAMIQRNYRDGELLEELMLFDDRVALTRHNPRGRPQAWEANPHWVRVSMHKHGGPVPMYVTLYGNGREVEIGAFLSPDEREALYDDLSQRLPARP